jgi:hypothetical protein
VVDTSAVKQSYELYIAMFIRVLILLFLIYHMALHVLVFPPSLLSIVISLLLCALGSSNCRVEANIQ